MSDQERLWTALKRLSDAAPVELAPLIDEASVAADERIAVEREATRLALEKAVGRHRCVRALVVALAIATEQLQIVRESFRLDGLEVSVDLDKAIEVARGALTSATGEPDRA